MIGEFYQKCLQPSWNFSRAFIHPNRCLAPFLNYIFQSWRYHMQCPFSRTHSEFFVYISHQFWYEGVAACVCITKTLLCLAPHIFLTPLNYIYDWPFPTSKQEVNNKADFLWLSHRQSSPLSQLLRDFSSHRVLVSLLHLWMTQSRRGKSNIISKRKSSFLCLATETGFLGSMGHLSCFLTSDENPRVCIWLIGFSFKNFVLPRVLVRKLRGNNLVYDYASGFAYSDKGFSACLGGKWKRYIGCTL